MSKKQVNRGAENQFGGHLGHSPFRLGFFQRGRSLCWQQQQSSAVPCLPAQQKNEDNTSILHSLSRGQVP
jgi:hypothetical protein